MGRHWRLRRPYGPNCAANLPERLSSRIPDIQLSAWWKPPHPSHVVRCVIRRSGRGRIERIIMSLAAGTRLGPYEILASIGAGGMGEVFRARDPRLGRDVA